MNSDSTRADRVPQRICAQITHSWFEAATGELMSAPGREQLAFRGYRLEHVRNVLIRQPRLEALGYCQNKEAGERPQLI
jgi:hypothetical protein